jgi:hypothetical protein
VSESSSLPLQGEPGLSSARLLTRAFVFADPRPCRRTAQIHQGRLQRRLDGDRTQVAPRREQRHHQASSLRQQEAELEVLDQRCALLLALPTPTVQSLTIFASLPIVGVEATAKDVRERVQELNIQVGNLW